MELGNGELTQMLARLARAHGEDARAIKIEPMYADPYLQQVERIENNLSTPENEKLLMLFASWLNVRKGIEFPEYPQVLVQEFLGLEKVN